MYLWPCSFSTDILTVVAAHLQQFSAQANCGSGPHSLFALLIITRAKLCCCPMGCTILLRCAQYLAPSTYLDMIQQKHMPPTAPQLSPRPKPGTGPEMGTVHFVPFSRLISFHHHGGPQKWNSADLDMIQQKHMPPTPPQLSPRPPDGNRQFVKFVHSLLIT